GGEDIENEITNFECIGSYCWVNTEKPTITVPGSPPMWRDRALPYTVQPDGGTRFVDQNDFRVPSAVMYPLVRSVDIMAEEAGDEFDWKSVDFITDRNNLRKLLRWIHDGDIAEEFRIDTQLAGTKTVLLNRWERRSREAPYQNWNSYSLNYTRESTTPAPGCERCTSQYRIVKYASEICCCNIHARLFHSSQDFNGIRLVVRSAVDAFIAPISLSTSNAALDPDSVADLLSGMKISAPRSAAWRVDHAISTPELDVIRGGSRVPQDSIIEYKTRSVCSKGQLPNLCEDFYAQLFLSQTPHFYVAFHQHGRFETVIKRQLNDPEMKQIQDKLNNDFKMLREILVVIQRRVIEHGQRGRLSLVQQNGQLHVHERDSLESCLPEDLLKRFEWCVELHRVYEA
ncbi:hypothetical protein WOLCODRAFT_78910, partial [Wolfiporia cocos MD-104 SS10]